MDSGDDQSPLNIMRIDLSIHNITPPEKGIILAYVV